MDRTNSGVKKISKLPSNGLHTVNVKPLDFITNERRDKRAERIQEREPGLLVVFSSKKCYVCSDLETSGFFDQLDKELDLGGDHIIEWIESKKSEPHDGASIFNLDQYFPSFKYMLASSYDRVAASGTNYKSVLNEICFFNREYDFSKNELKNTEVYKGMFSFENIQSFCYNSAIELESRRASQRNPVILKNKKMSMLTYKKYK